jgi:hypothetical protein
MKTNWTLALAAIALIFGSTPVAANPRNQDWKPIYRNNRGWSAVAYENGTKIIVTGVEQNGSAATVSTYYNPDGSVKSSDFARLSRNKKR